MGKYLLLVHSEITGRTVCCEDGTHEECVRKEKLMKSLYKRWLKSLTFEIREYQEQ